MEEMMTREQMEAFWENASAEAARSIKEVVLFRVEEKAEAESSGTGRGIQVEIIEAAGNMNLIMPGRLRQGSFVFDSDLDGCVISRETAEELFGSRQAVGEALKLDERIYIVRGVVETEGRLCMVQGEAGKAYPYIRIYAPEIPVSRVQQMLTAVVPEPSVGVNGISEDRIPGWISESDLYLGIGRMVLWMPAWVVLVFGGLKCRRKIWEMDGQKNKIMVEIWKVIFPVAVFAGICGILLVSVRFSDDYIPTAWSDFSFWTELVGGKIEAFFFLMKSPLQKADASMLANLGEVVCSSLAGAAALWNVLNREWGNRIVVCEQYIEV